MVLPYSMPTPSVLTCHDLIALENASYCMFRTSLYYKIFIPRSVLQAKVIIAVSKKVKQDIIKKFGVDERKIKVIYHGIDDCFCKVKNPDRLQEVRQKYRLLRPFILFVGNLEPKKNIPGLIQAYARLIKNSTLPHQLVIVGKKAWKYKKIFSLVRILKLEKQIVFTGYVPKDDLIAIYSLADQFVFPSFYEGFGLPPLEAMACGTPVITSNRGALPEVTGGHCQMVAPHDIDGLAKAMYELITNLDMRNKTYRYSTVLGSKLHLGKIKKQAY